MNCFLPRGWWQSQGRETHGVWKEDRAPWWGVPWAVESKKESERLAATSGHGKDAGDGVVNEPVPFAASRAALIRAGSPWVDQSLFGGVGLSTELSKPSLFPLENDSFRVRVSRKAVAEQ
ncbi:hypothetical protein Acr_00g0079850 [Actinidia rufa]|uniref:Uncharacterized protein n=1 Tax=Actinidia rufa TaxID=165716 RepID=A0A7J0DVQ8_9ERIC|nr:hypothetical protein Acr_00g0079850 [Actinidia rufa]